MLALLRIETKHKTRHCQGENSFIKIHEMYKEKLKKKNTARTGIWEKMSKAIEENNLPVMIKRLSWEFNVY